MKKPDLYIGLGYLILGTVLFGLALFTQYRLESLLWGFGGACFGSGVVTTCKYLHWSKPENQSEYNEKLRIEKIEMEDERQTMIRDKSGCITYKIMLMLYCGLIVVCYRIHSSNISISCNCICDFTYFSIYMWNHCI